MRQGEAGTGRQQTALVKMFDPGTMAQQGRAAASSVLGQCHESNLPRRPPCHWLMPPRKSVVDAPLPWRVPRAGQSRPPGARHPETRPDCESGKVCRACDKVVRCEGASGGGVREQFRHGAGQEASVAGSQHASGPSARVWRIDSFPVRDKRSGMLLDHSRRRRFENELLWRTGRNHYTRPHGSRLTRDPLPGATPIAPVLSGLRPPVCLLQAGREGGEALQPKDPVTRPCAPSWDTLE